MHVVNEITTNTFKKKERLPVFWLRRLMCHSGRVSPTPVGDIAVR